ncbi:hypothetical protein [Bacillus toyonensis]|uniref:hypothetical protein n=1 Tax=Bacillus toyonensis TaxID=155322 RepID=UPI002E1A6C6E|nr:hypothetical protein [Bacillus toyonensis]
MLSFENVMQNRFLILDCLLDQNFCEKIMSDKKKVQKINDYLWEPKNRSELLELVKSGKYKEYVENSRGEIKGGKNIKEFAGNTLSEAFSFAVGVPIGILSAPVKSLINKYKNKNLEEFYKLLFDEIGTKNIQNIIDGHINKDYKGRE